MDRALDIVWRNSAPRPPFCWALLDVSPDAVVWVNPKGGTGVPTPPTARAIVVSLPLASVDALPELPSPPHTTSLRVVVHGRSTTATGLARILAWANHPAVCHLAWLVRGPGAAAALVEDLLTRPRGSDDPLLTVELGADPVLASVLPAMLHHATPVLVPAGREQLRVLTALLTGVWTRAQCDMLCVDAESAAGAPPLDHAVLRHFAALSLRGPWAMVQRLVAPTRTNTAPLPGRIMVDITDDPLAPVDLTAPHQGPLDLAPHTATFVLRVRTTSVPTTVLDIPQVQYIVAMMGEHPASTLQTLVVRVATPLALMGEEDPSSVLQRVLPPSVTAVVVTTEGP